VTACFACDRPFPANEELEWLSTGRVVAFDAARGRLWIVCGWCSNWTLVPLESRWEGVEELERRSSSAPRLAATDEISLLGIGSIRAVRVGEALPTEEAWWRFGPSLRGRNRRYSVISSVGGRVAAGASVAGMLALALVPGVVEIAAFKGAKVSEAPKAARGFGSEAAVDFDRWLRFGRYAWRGQAQCGKCGAVLRRLRYRDRYAAQVQPDGSVSVRCTRCRKSDPGHVINRAEAQDVIRRCLSYTNIAGATTGQLSSAVELIRGGMITAGAYIGPLSLRFLPRDEAIALELALTERAEAEKLGWEIRELEARWRSAEALAVIIDGELS
jgi:hypothetical protein